MLLSSKFRHKVVTYGGVAGVCVWYCFRKAWKRDDDSNKRRGTIRLNKSPVKGGTPVRGGSMSPKKVD
jgi:hypothetical protein